MTSSVPTTAAWLRFARSRSTQGHLPRGNHVSANMEADEEACFASATAEAIGDLADAVRGFL